MMGKMNIILSTAGHIDHGKTYLIEKLTGKNTMHHKEELQRNITIDLGYSFMSLCELNVSIIDVPGHKDYLKNTICGILNSNMSILVVSAVDGVCHQTIEHFKIIEYSSIDNLIIAITKTDLATEDNRRQTLIQVEKLIEKSNKKSIKILDIDYSKPLNQLKQVIYDFSQNISFKRVLPYNIVKIDNSFSINGYGTVVSGNLLHGSFYLGQEVTIYPKKIRSKIRIIESHKKNLDKIERYSRVAFNLPKISVGDINRGYVLSTSDNLYCGDVLEVWVHSTKELKNLKNHENIKLLIGTNKINASLVFIEKNRYAKDYELIQLRLKEEHLCFVKDDMIILNTLGNIVTGGIIINPLSYKFPKYDDNSSNLIDDLRLKDIDKLIFLSLLHTKKIIENEYLENILCFSKEKIEEIIRYFKEKKFIICLGQVENISNFYIVKSDYYTKLVEKIRQIISEFTNKYKYRAKMSLDIIYSNLNYISPAIIREILNIININSKNGMIILKSDTKCNDDVSKSHLDLIKKIKKSTSIISVNDLIGYDKNLREILYNDLSDLIVIIDKTHIVSKETYNTYLSFIKNHFLNHERLTISDFKVEFNISRNNAVLILEFFDLKKITKRFDNYRIKLYNG